jgi:hypothetical protein
MRKRLLEGTFEQVSQKGTPLETNPSNPHEEVLDTPQSPARAPILSMRPLVLMGAPIAGSVDSVQEAAPGVGNTRD